MGGVRINLVHKIVTSSLQHCAAPELHWSVEDPPPPPEGESVRGTAVAAAKSGRTKNKKVKTVATRENIVTEL